MTGEAHISSDYVFDHARGMEIVRLEEQARRIDPLTERLFLEAGIGLGMRVLDLGSGAGDVALLLAKIVGPSGEVVGLDLSPRAVSTARRRAELAGAKNVDFLQGDIHNLGAVSEQLGSPFDAAVGRFILQFSSDPALALRSAADRVRPGGLICFQEVDDWYTWAYPSTPLWDKVRTWFLAALQHAGVEQRMGMRLFQSYESAGLAQPELRLEAVIGGGHHAPAFLWAGVIRGISHIIEEQGIADISEVDPDSLASRLLQDSLTSNGIVIGPPLIGAWCRR